MPARNRQSLIFDADDTLWENNVIFERTTDEFVAWVAGADRDPAQVRAVLVEVEEANIARHGYGSAVYLRSLAETHALVTGTDADAAARLRLAEYAARFTYGSVQLLPAVADVLTHLGARHELYLMTKGTVDEQQRKIDASGLAARFAGVDIVAVKEPETYRQLVTDRDLDPERSWMIGNSPRSDILAARAAGLRAVFIPNENTWAHEHADLDPSDDGILHLTTFADLIHHF